MASLRERPPLVAPGEIQRLREQLAEASEGRRFVLQGGDCAETFASCTAPALQAKLQVLLQMSLVLTYATRKPVIRIGRIAGQYAKPRSQPTEVVAGRTLPVYRGDLVNGLEPDPAARVADPRRMVEAYHHAAASLNYLRALIEGGFADLHHPERWDLGFIRASTRRAAYQRTVDSIVDAIEFMDQIGASSRAALARVELYTSHEALLLPYEEALTRDVPGAGAFNLGAHLLWIGYRTGGLAGAHVEYVRGLANPIGIKVGPDSEPAALVELLGAVDPAREKGRVVLITRLGHSRVAERLPLLIAAVERSGHRVLWSCDPMHGNTEQLTGGRKTRRVGAIFDELEQSFELHARSGSYLGGVHFEMTGEDVTECIGDAVDPCEADLPRYETACDPRLNGSQSLEMAFLIAETLRRGKPVLGRG